MHQKTKLFFLVAVVGVLIVGALFVRPWLQNRTVSTIAIEKIERPALNFSFAFPSGEDAYTYIEPTMSTTTGGPDAAFIMVRSDAYADYEKATPGGEAPPSMSIFVFTEQEVDTATSSVGTTSRTRMEKLRTWAEVNSGLTLYDRPLAPHEEVKIDGVKALHYKADGLYMNDIYIMFNKNRYYLVVGQYDGETDPAYGAFKDLVNSILFM